MTTKQIQFRADLTRAIGAALGVLEAHCLDNPVDREQVKEEIYARIGEVLKKYSL